MPSGSSLALLAREIDGKFQQGLTYKQSEKELRFNWLPTGKSKLSGNIMEVERIHDALHVRDYSGTAASLDYNLSITGKLGLTLGWKRNLSAYGTGYYVGQVFNISPVWQISGKTSLRGNYSVEARGYKGLGARAEETYKQSLLALDWSPLRTLSLSASYQHQSRDTSLVTAVFDANMTTISANLAF
jgi:hypothetical protein